MSEDVPSYRRHKQSGQAIVLTLPAGYEPGKRYPLLRIIHGGPTGVFDQEFIAAPLHPPYPVAVLAPQYSSHVVLPVLRTAGMRESK